MTRFTCAALIALIPTLAAADDRLERFEAVAEAMNGVMAEMMAVEIESMGGDATAIRDAAITIPPWDDAMRAAAQCSLERYEAATNPAAVDAMLVEMETMIEQLSTITMTEFVESEMAESAMPEGLTDEDAFAISTECGMMDLQIEAAQASGLMDAMMTAGATVPNNN